MTKIWWPPARVDEKAICLLSGDQVGSKFVEFPTESEPPAVKKLMRFVARSNLAILALAPGPAVTNAMDFRSGDHAGANSKVLERLTSGDSLAGFILGRLLSWIQMS